MYALFEFVGVLPNWLMLPVRLDGDVDHAYSHFLTLQSGVFAFGVPTLKVLLPHHVVDEGEEGVLTP
jgi:hypothetical protein